jgi:uncharacterized protein (DUF362 family)/Pyruvate/2-oxoacid:ferredoxin oxidoreductase delta subunit
VAYQTFPVVSIAACGSYSREEVEPAVRKAIEALGGIDAFVKPKSHILLKPNLLQGLPPERCVVTHPEIIRALSRICREVGCTVVIADSPGGGIRYTPANLKKIYHTTGYEDIPGDTGAELNTDTGYSVLPFPEGRLVKSFPVINAVTEADQIIVVSKAKTHLWTLFTGGTKNLFGVIPGIEKPLHHARFRNIDTFAGMILDLNALIFPTLQIMDAVVGMEGDGPSSGKPRKIGAILASTDANAIDMTTCRIMGIPPLDVPTIRVAVSRGLIGSDPDHIRLVGDPLESLPAVHARMPSTYRGPGQDLTPSLLLGLIHRIGGVYALYPYFDRGTCQRCGQCKLICPSGAITLREGLPEFNKKTCFRCYCCHEICPSGAVHLKPGTGRKLLRRITGL